MNSSSKSTQQAEPASFPLAGPAVMSRRLAPATSGLSDWMELMDVIEALCPVWPERQAVAEEGAVYKL